MTTLALMCHRLCLGNVQGVADFITNLDGILYGWMHMNYSALRLRLDNAEKHYVCVSLFFFFGEECFMFTVGPVQEEKAKLCFSSWSCALFT